MDTENRDTANITILKKKKTISKLKKELDKVFSQYIRMSHSHNGITQCFTCSKSDHWKNMHAGHFQSRKHLATRWDEQNVKVQCVKCNIFDSGQQYAFGKLLDILYGEGTSDGLVIKARMTQKMMRQEYIDMIDLYKQKIKDLENV